MKSITQVLLGTAFVYLTSFVPAASAQMQEPVTINLPFSAYFGSTLIPAGHYFIAQVHNSSSQPILEIESNKGVHFFLNVNRMESNREADKTEVTLSQRSGSYYASKLELAGSAEYFELAPVEKK